MPSNRPIFDGPFDVKCYRCKAEINKPCRDAEGNDIAGYHAERHNEVNFWNAFFVKFVPAAACVLLLITVGCKTPTAPTPPTAPTITGVYK